MNALTLIQNKKIALALGMIVVVAAIVVSGTGAFFSDSETSANNIFTAGAIDLTVDHAFASYNDEVCTSNCTPDGQDLIVNGGFEDPVLANGTWGVYPAGITGWTVESGSGIEVQNNAAGAPHSGSNLVELDSNDQSSMSQAIVTVPGEKYRLSFWYSPRPGIPAGDNEIGYQVSVVSDNTVIASETVGETAVGSGNTVWELVTVDFVAQSASTKILFADQGDVNNSLGGYIDDVSVMHVTCTPGEYENTPGGFCELWTATNLTDESFFNFTDVKPGDEGVNVMSLHIETNDAFVCAFAHDIEDEDNTLTEPEAEVPDTLVDGELDDVLQFMIWKDDGDGDYELTDGAPIVPAGSDIEDFDLGALSVLAGGTSYLGIAWCAGTQTLSGATISCNGASETNVSQTDSLSASLTLYAIQQRNNENFSCEDVEIPGVTDEDDEPEIDWTDLGTRTGGSVVEANGMITMTTINDVDSRVRYNYGPINVNLSAITGFTYDSRQVSANDAVNGNASFRLVVDLDGDLTTLGDVKDVTYEPYYNIFAHNSLNAPAIVTGIWQTWSASQTNGKFWSSGVTTAAGLSGGGGDYVTNFTIAQLVTAFPNAKVVGISVGMGTYNVNQVVEVDNLNFNTGMITGF